MHIILLLENIIAEIQQQNSEIFFWLVAIQRKEKGLKNHQTRIVEIP